MNKVLLVGRFTRDPEVRYSSQTAIARFTLAVDRRFKSETQTADFISCVAFSKTAEFIEKYVAKGMKMAVEGRWQTGSYKNKDGNTIYTNDCVVEHIEFCEAKKSGQQNYQQDYTTQGNFVPDGFEEVPEEDLPF